MSNVTASTDWKRPTPGETTTRTLKVKVCKGCGCALSDSGLCDYGCDFDGASRTPANTFVAVYNRVDTFVRDEEFVIDEQQTWPPL